jgi:hypothetical protein
MVRAGRIHIRRRSLLGVEYARSGPELAGYRVLLHMSWKPPVGMPYDRSGPELIELK